MKKLILGAALLLAAWLPAQAASLSGVVLDGPQGAGVQGAQIICYNANGSDIRVTTSTPDGAYQLEDLQPDIWQLTASHPDFYTNSQVILLMDGSNTFDFILQSNADLEPASLEGWVMDATTGLPVAGAQAVWSASPAEPPANDLTDDQGHFQLTSLLSGIGALTVTAEGYRPSLQQLQLAPGPNSIQVLLAPVGSDSLGTLVRGVIRDAFTREPVPGVLVQLLPEPNFGDTLTVVTGDDGEYLFANLLSGIVVLLAGHPDYSPRAEVLFLMEGPNIFDIELVPVGDPQPASLEGWVIDATTGLPVAGAQAAWSADPSVPPLDELSDGQGYFFIDGLSSGVGQLSLTAPGYWSSNQEILLAPGPNAIQVALYPAGSDSLGTYIWGSVRDILTREPLAGALVQIWSEPELGDTVNVVTGEDGSFFAAVPSMNQPIWYLQASADGYLPTQQAVPGVFGQYWTELLLMPEAGPSDWAQLNGQVIQNGMPVEGAALEAIDVANPAWGLSYYALTNPTGGYSLDLPSGSYVLACRFYQANGEFQTLYYPGVSSFTEALPLMLSPNEVHTGLDFNLDLMEGDSLRVLVNGRVTDESGQPLAGVRVRVWTANEELVDASVLTDSQGVYQTAITEDRLPIVPFSLSAEVAGHVMEFFSDSPTFTLATQFLILSDASISNLDFQLAPLDEGVSLGGQVNLPGAGSALVAAFSPAGDFMRTVTASPDGHFQFDGLPDRELALLYSAPGHLPVFSGGGMDLAGATLIQPADATPQSAALALQMPAAGPVSVVGHVRDSAGVGLEGALVMAHTAATGDLRFGVTDLEGSFHINGLANNVDVTLHVSVPGYATGQSFVHTDSGQQQTVQVDTDLTALDEAVLSPAPRGPRALELAANSPNPFNPTTTLAFTLAHPADARLTVFDLRGAQVWERHFPAAAAGDHRVTFDGSALASGIYLVQLEANGLRQSRSMLLLK